MFIVTRTIWKSINKFLEDDCLTSGAAMAFFTIFSFPPLVVIVLMITSALGFTRLEVDRIIHEELGFPKTQTVTGIDVPTAAPESAPKSTELEAPAAPRSAADRLMSFRLGDLGWISKAIGIGILLLSASGTFGQLQVSLNRIWEVEPDPNAGWLQSFFLKRFLSAVMVITIGLVLLISLVLTTVIDQILYEILGDIPGPTVKIVGIILNESAAFLVVILLFAAMYKLLPDTKLRWSDVWGGAIVTAFLFVIGKALIGWYLRTSQVGANWGSSAASSLAALVWVYYSSLIVLYGAELTNVWATRHGKGFEPAPGAVKTIEEKRHIR